VHEAVFFGLVIAFPVIGVVTRRWLVVALPLVAWPIFYLGLNKGWWLDGTGDGWQPLAWFFTVFGVASTALAVGIGRSVRPLPSRIAQSS
jgi:hypothetical protein